MAKKVVHLRVLSRLLRNHVDMATIVLVLAVGSDTLVEIQVQLQTILQFFRILIISYLTNISDLFYLNFLLENIQTPPVTPPITTSTPQSVTTPPSHLYYSHSWIPHDIEISLDSNCELFVEKISTPKSDSNESSKTVNEVIVENGQGDNKIQESEISGEEEKVVKNHVSTVRNDDVEKGNKTDENLDKISKIRYSLSAVVCYIDDKSNEDKRNIVALLRVGPNYHERSAGSAVSQWYIFNDFWYVNAIHFLYSMILE